uniref:Uncharacterized protein n=1 Tax=Tanacetum cinerariifolium TaxID=118510 RepID=A0A6L2KG18_TANCI|nr:hypothetical protein [Tanacetum cinerariifolium]
MLEMMVIVLWMRQRRETIVKATLTTYLRRPLNLRLPLLNGRSGSGGANEASFCANEDYDIYDGHEDYAYELSEEQKAFYQVWDINLRSQVRR